MDLDCSGCLKIVKNREQSLNKKIVLIRCLSDFNLTDIEYALTEMSLKQILSGFFKYVNQGVHTVITQNSNIFPLIMA